MNAILWPFFNLVAKNKWLQIVLAVLSGWFLIWLYLRFRDDGIRKQMRAKERERALEEQARVDQTRREITEGNNEARHQADEAVSNLPQYRATDELRRNDPDAAAIVLGSGERRSS